MRFVEVPSENFAKRREKIILVANTRKTIVRIADVFSRGKIDQWEFVQKFFPLGEKLDEKTHVFDGSVFAAQNSRAHTNARFFMTALPVSLCEELTQIGIKITGSLHRIARLETAEHIIFRKYAPICTANELHFVFFPHNDDGIAVLQIENSLPRAAFHISNEPEYRENEFMRVCAAAAMPRFFEDAPPQENQRPDNQHTKKHAIFLTREADFCDKDFKWLREILEHDGFDIREEIFSYE